MTGRESADRRHMLACTAYLGIGLFLTGVVVGIILIHLVRVS